MTTIRDIDYKNTVTLILCVNYFITMFVDWFLEYNSTENKIQSKKYIVLASIKWIQICEINLQMRNNEVF